MPSASGTTRNAAPAGPDIGPGIGMGAGTGSAAATWKSYMSTTALTRCCPRTCRSLRMTRPLPGYFTNKCCLYSPRPSRAQARAPHGQVGPRR
ncbi:hypothetical protein GCM10023235_03450 [Kitasatospora terrestris]|uniref:Uncharacterized protein n=1 Tax=Kitasatospora terrestris TaxID=258051 RepID=A0ABP9D7B7_9ACTN